ncbi:MULTISPECIES: uroporphyrinogen-III C-methyltransferase [Spirulina sp. CCY15215]|uniref:uroporphyrinogen-III C-methyltransferase n=1 Tax=Spirulina sp. CCY15215 TaxID=2767591 RepID=UPI0019526504|nr:uroporphyrinogen-III C-methyltransferase [Spirulina major]
MNDQNTCQGKVYLLGAGVGNLDSLTLKGDRLLQAAEVLIYDALISDELLTRVPVNCLKLEVGKRGGKASTPQTEINRLLVTYCSQGKQVVRLKSGDPFIFGRVREEVEALQKAGCNFEIIAGISSALAAPLLAGIPLTDKYLSRCFTVLSAHQPENLDWEALAKIDTLVILMGGRNLGKIVAYLLQNGRSPSHPIAIIRNAGSSQQQIWRGNLANIQEQTQAISLSPCIMVIGAVVNLQEMFQSSHALPLDKKTILVTRAAEQSSYFAGLLLEHGGMVLEMPALEITPPSSWQELDSAIASLDTFHWLILTSSNAVHYFCKRLETLGKDLRSLGGIKIAVVGKKTAKTLREYHLIPDFIPPNFVADSLAENFPDRLPGLKILFPRVETGGREILVQELNVKGANVVEVPAYQSGCPDRIDPYVLKALQSRSVQIITFASAKTVQNCDRLFKQSLHSQELEEILASCCLASIGPQTSKTCLDLFGRVDVEAKEYTLEGLTKAIVEYFSA